MQEPVGLPGGELILKSDMDPGLRTRLPHHPLCTLSSAPPLPSPRFSYLTLPPSPALFPSPCALGSASFLVMQSWPEDILTSTGPWPAYRAGFESQLPYPRLCDSGPYTPLSRDLISPTQSCGWRLGTPHQLGLQSLQDDLRGLRPLSMAQTGKQLTQKPRRLLEPQACPGEGGHFCGSQKSLALLSPPGFS